MNRPQLLYVRRLEAFVATHKLALREVEFEVECIKDNPMHNQAQPGRLAIAESVIQKRKDLIAEYETKIQQGKDTQ